MPIIFVVHLIGFHHHANIGGVELMINNGAISDKATEAQMQAELEERKGGDAANGDS